MADGLIVGFVHPGSFFQPGASESDKEDVRKSVGATKSNVLSKSLGIELMRFPAGVNVLEKIEQLNNHPKVEYAEVNYKLHKALVPDDPNFSSLWGMQGPDSTPAEPDGCNAAGAWDKDYVGDGSVVVGVIDEGIQYTHPDLADNMWVNPGEIAGNGIDDDGNGFVDDVHGWDFYSNNDSVYDGTGDDHG